MFSNDLVVHLLDYIDFNLYKRISMEELSNSFHYHKDHIMRVFKRELGVTIIDYINQKRVYLSLESLKDRNSTILGISLQYGFYSQEYYSEMFHKVMGVSPRTFRLFLSHSFDISDNEVYIIQDSLAKYLTFFKRIDIYRHNIPPKDTVKVLSIFK